MEDTLYEGDIILVSKFNYGALIPETFLRSSYLKILLNNINPEILRKHRFPGFKRVNRQDVVVFKWDIANGRRIFFVKRCIGLPHDTISLKHAKVYINSALENENTNLKHNYLISISDRDRFINCCDSLSISYDSHKKMNDKYILGLSKKHLSDLFAINVISSASVIEETKNRNKCWPIPNGNYTCDNYSSIITPYRGEEITFTLSNIISYWRILKKYEGVNLSIRKSELSGRSVEFKKYCLNYDYYFVLGDNRHNSEDSRFLGPVCEKDIVGKAVIVLFSWDKLKKNFRMNRFFKLIR